MNVPGQLPFVVNEGQLVFVTRVEFDYQGPPATLQVGFGWKPTAAFLGTNFNNGDNLWATPFGGFGHTNAFDVPDTPVFSPFFSDFVIGGTPFAAAAPAPAIGVNTRRGGTTDTVSGGNTFGSWVWIYDTAVLGHFALGPDTSFLAIDTDANVIQMVSGGGVPGGQDVANLQALYSL